MKRNISTIRAFFGIPVPEKKARAFQQLIQESNPKLKHQVRWTRPENHHVTVRFLGNIEESKLPTFNQAIEEAIKNITPFQVTLTSITPFPTHHGRLAAINVQPSFELQSLFNAINQIALDAGFPPENRPYLPHITTFRVADKKEIDLNKISLHGEILAVNELVLYQSVPNEKGSLYIPLHHFALT